MRPFCRPSLREPSRSAVEFLPYRSPSLLSPAFLSVPRLPFVGYFCCAVVALLPFVAFCFLCILLCSIVTSLCAGLAAAFLAAARSLPRPCCGPWRRIFVSSCVVVFLKCTSFARQLVCECPQSGQCQTRKSVALWWLSSRPFYTAALSAVRSFLRLGNKLL